MNFIFPLDQQMTALTAAARSPFLTNFFLWFTKLGDWKVVAGLMTIATIGFWLFKKKNYIIPLWLSVVASEACVYILKILVNRQRPALALITEHDASFPSGHANISIAFYGLLFYFLLLSLNNRAAKIIAASAGIIFIALLGFSRIYLGVHYLSDVIAGYFLGALWLLFSIKLKK